MTNSFFRHTLTSFAFISLLVGTTFSTACKSTRVAQGGTDTLPHALLWKIDGKGLGQPSYLFGTIHVIPKGDMFWPSGFEDVFQKVDKVVFEIDLDDMTNMGSMMELMTSLIMTDGTTLKNLLTPAEYKEVSTYFEGMGLPMMMLNTVKPMFLSMLAEVNVAPGGMEDADMASYEMDIYEKANTAGKSVGGLETMAYQMSVLDNIPYKEQAKMLLDAVRSVNVESEGFDEMVEIYKTQNIEAMVQMVSEEGEGGLAGYEDVLLNNRNQNWIPLMARKMEKGSVLFAVGAGHLAGEEGVIKLLKKEGYSVTPVSVYKGAVSRRT